MIHIYLHSHRLWAVVSPGALWVPLAPLAPSCHCPLVVALGYYRLGKLACEESGCEPYWYSQHGYLSQC